MLCVMIVRRPASKREFIDLHTAIQAMFDLSVVA